MPPKKDKGAADPKAAEGVEPGENPGTLLVNYTKFCKQVGIQPNQKLINSLTEEGPLAEFEKTHQLAIDDEFGPLGAGGTRALCTAIMGAVPGPGAIPVPFKLINSLRLWRCNVGDDGACSLAEVAARDSDAAR